MTHSDADTPLATTQKAVISQLDDQRWHLKWPNEVFELNCRTHSEPLTSENLQAFNEQVSNALDKASTFFETAAARSI